MAFKRGVLLAAVVLIAVSVWSAAVVICEKCGHEAVSAQTVCAHCGAALPAVLTPASPAPFAETAQAAGTNLAAQALAAVREDVRLARENEAARPELALSFYGNALAVLRLVPRESLPADAGSRLVDGMDLCRGSLSRVARPCPTCGGSGSRKLKLQSLAGGEDNAAAGGVLCETCEGLGMVRSGRTADELRVALGQGRRDFEVRQQAAGRVAVGRAWVPPALAAQLALPAQVLLRSAAAAPCKDCQGIGRQTCATCRGLCRTKCRQTGCDGGWIIKKSTNVLTPKTALRQRTPCPSCQGTGWTACSGCRGSGAVACAACQGSGQPPRCTRCGGEGTAICTRCRGAGRVGKVACESCGGVGQTLCTSCYGEGRLSR